uniref:Histone deacetylase 8 n=1 Tax=Phallusia mammillata TaxID=59560 RepID=A0A6F9DF41_9ASCI|nr:histone deacetylase 8-like [Phallusia mammillata]
MVTKPVAYVCNELFVSQSDHFIPTENRNSMVHGLITACDLLGEMIVVKPSKADIHDLQLFHESTYLDHLKNASCDTSDEENGEDIAYGLGYDCPLSDGILDYCKMIAGGSLAAAKLLCSKQCQIAVHWLGGWHHAKRDRASGYCYVNDCVLSILELRKQFKKVLYIDLDVHHGDGVQDAFYATDKVLTYSVHKFEPGFYPGTGSLDDIGFGKGKYYTVNVPLKDGIDDEQFVFVNKQLLTVIRNNFNPDAIVCQVGADGLSGDPMQSFSLTTDGLRLCVEHITKWNLPTLVLGGGGYNEANVAKCWCTITASILTRTLPSEIPEHDFFPMYGPDFVFDIDKSNRKDTNTSAYLSSIVNCIMGNLNKLYSKI